MKKQLLKRIYMLLVLLLINISLVAQNAFIKNTQKMLQDSTLVASLRFGTEIDSFYKLNNYIKIFSKSDATIAIESLKERNFLSYWIIESLSNKRNIRDKIQAELLLVDALLLEYSKVNSAKISISDRFQSEEPTAGFFYPEKQLDILDVLHIYIKSNDITVFEKNEIANQQYVELEKQLKLYQELALANDWDSIFLTETDTLKLGNRNEIVSVIRQRLYQTKDLKEGAKLSSTIFDKDVEQALKNYQYRHNIDTNGLIEMDVINTLNKPIENIVNQLEANIERWKWLPNDLGDYYVHSNIPSFSTKLIENDTLVAFHKTVVGKPVRATPLFYDTMTYMDVNPTWTVPPTIVENEILSNPSGYIASHKLTIIKAATGEVVPKDSVNWSKYKHYKFIQGAGSGNALGLLKFIFPNQHYIFIHDTPTKRHFAYNYRAYSSGCMRIENPQDFATSLLKEDTIYTPEKIEEYLEKGKTKRIVLDKQPIVYLTYFTLQVNDDGQLMFYPDVYGYDEILTKKLAAK